MNKLKKLKAAVIKQSKEVLKQSEIDKKRLLSHITKIEIDITTAEAIIKGMKDE